MKGGSVLLLFVFLIISLPTIFGQIALHSNKAVEVGGLIVDGHSFSELSSAVDSLRETLAVVNASVISLANSVPTLEKIIARCENDLDGLRIGPDCAFSPDLSLKINWFEAVSRCKALGGTLLYIMSEEEQLALQHFLGNSTEEHLVSGNFWLGLNDMNISNIWVWEHSPFSAVWVGLSTGSAQNNNYANFRANEPNGSGDCAHMYPSTLDYTWDDAPCTALLNHMCRVPLATLAFSL
eukprot:GCRY01001139.1.p1 GENE.GCRY01001139.1~~GCRY01001139.1.p1  ORF type:complete len:238 (-),score=25.38 GCRY01001139.1:229-942(-)